MISVRNIFNTAVKSPNGGEWDPVVSGWGLSWPTSPWFLPKADLSQRERIGRWCNFHQRWRAGRDLPITGGGGGFDPCSVFAKKTVS